jgi:hypothetical protein
MSELVELESKLKEAKEKRKKIIIDSFDGRPQSYISEQTGIDQIKLNRWINNTASLEDSEIDALENYLGVNLR